jgi:hypothetical protein
MTAMKRTFLAFLALTVTLTAFAADPPSVVRLDAKQKTDVITDAAITANGIIESIAQGFRFPNGSVQTSAARPAGGIPSVNGITSAVTIAHAGTASIGTTGSTITIATPGFGSPVAVSTTNAAGVASTFSRSDHVHAHGNHSGGSLHATATTSDAGFMAAADKAKLDTLAAYVRTIVVTHTGDATTSGAALITAVNNISDNGVFTPYLVRLEPGVYNIGSSLLQMKSYVDIEGWGQNATFITATRGGSSLLSSSAAVAGALNSELRNLTINNTASSGSTSIAFFATGNGTLRLRDVTINSTGGTSRSYGIYATTSNVKLFLFNCTVTATGVGNFGGASGVGIGQSATVSILASRIRGTSPAGTMSETMGVNSNASGGTLIVDGSTIVGSGGATTLYAVAMVLGTATISNSVLSVDTNASRIALSVGSSTNFPPTVKVSNSQLLCGVAGSTNALSAAKGVDSTLRIGASQLDGATTGVPTCVHVYDSNFADLNDTCPAPIG